MNIIIKILRHSTDGAPNDNRSVARFLWVALSGVPAAVLVWPLLGTLSPTVAGEGLGGIAAFQDAAAVYLVGGLAWVFIGSLVWPSRRIQAWLDDRYPDHCAEELDYSALNDLVGSVGLTVLYALYGGILYAGATIALTMVAVLSALNDAGYPLEPAEVTQLTVVNSFAIATLAIILAGVASWWLINRLVGSFVAELSTPENNTFVFHGPDDRALTDGGDRDA